MQRSYEGPTENRLGELGSLYKYYYYYYYYIKMIGILLNVVYFQVHKNI